MLWTLSHILNIIIFREIFRCHFSYFACVNKSALRKCLTWITNLIDATLEFELFGEQMLHHMQQSKHGQNTFVKEEVNKSFMMVLR